MSATPVITWFEIPTQNYQRAIEFYQKVFNVTLQQETMDELSMAVFPHEDSQASGAVVDCSQSTPHNDGVVIYLFSTDFDATIERIEANGGSLVMPKTEIPAGLIALFIDSEGNRIGLHGNA